MLSNYLKIAFRSLKRNKIYTTINILGLGVGIACCLLISVYVYHEMSYDHFFEDSDRIFRVALERQYPTNTKFFGSSPVNLAKVLRENYDEVEAAGRIHRLFFQNQITVNIGDESFVETNYLFADDDFLKVLAFDFIEGSPEAALDQANKAILTESTARKYFGEGSALNKTYRIDTTEFIVTGVIRDLPSNSHMAFDVLGSTENLGFIRQSEEDNNWISPSVYTYIKLKPGMDYKALDAKMGAMFMTYGLPSILTRLDMSESEYPSSGHGFNYFLQPLTDIHLKSNFSTELQANSTIFYVYLLSAVVVFILLISCINFVNLATARSAERGKEVGVRKVLGSNRSSLIRQFLTESNILSLTAMILAVVAVWVVWPSFNNLLGEDLSLSILTSSKMLLGLLAFAILIGTTAGLYPAFVLSNVETANVLKGNYKSSGKGVWLRNFLIVFQFFISVTMISGTLLLNKQMSYVSNKPLGFNKENVVVIEQAGALGSLSEVFKNKIKQLEGVLDVGAGFAMPGDFIGNRIIFSEIPDIPQIRSFSFAVDDHYVSALDLEIVAGRNFGEAFNDSTNVLVNETTARLLGYNDPIGKKVINRNLSSGATNDLFIVGVIKDYHHHSLHTEIPPLVITNSRTNNVPMGSMAIKIKSDNYQNVLQKIEASWNENVQNTPITYRFLDDKLQNLYQADLRTGKVFSIFTIVAIILACVGLFGLAAYVTQQRTKEIGVRKVLGASVFDIIFMLSKNFTRLILLSFVIAIPLVYFGMTRWFENFAYHTNVDIWTLVGAGVFTLLLAWLTIGYYSIRAAVINISKSLRTE